jgi:hypothetical protein
MRRMMRGTRSTALALAVFAAAADVLLPLGIAGHGVHFVDSPEGGGAAGGTGNPPAGGTGADDDAGTGSPAVGAQSATYPAQQYRDLDARRKKFQGAFKALLRMIGVDNPDAVKIKKTADPVTPWIIEGIEDLEQRAAAARMAGELGFSGGGGQRRGRQQQQTQTGTVTPQQLQVQVAAYKAQIGGLTNYIKRTAVIEPLRAACVKYGAIDDDSGRYSDIVNSLAARFRPEVEFDSDNASAEPSVRLDYVDESGQPFIDPNTGVAPTPDAVVSDFLTKRPKYRQANWRAGPGAGGAAVGVQRRPSAPLVTGNNNQQAQPAEMVRNVANFFGVDTQEVEQRAPRVAAAHSNGNGSGGRNGNR